jgi:hypothetical protein
MAIGKKILLTGFGIAVCSIGYGFHLDTQRSEKIGTDLAKQDLASFTRDSIDVLYQVRVEMTDPSEAQISEAGPALTVGTMRTTFNVDTSRLVPKIFNSFPNIMKIRLIRIMTGTDSRGNASQAKAIDLVFSRENSKTINWNRVAFDNLPSLADNYWIDPMLK